jgi:uncharacterized protein (DUF58 family)
MTVNFIDPAQLLQLGDLQLLARTVVQGLGIGLQHSPDSGSAIEFAQYRPYAQGDDSRSVDWRLYGRTDRLHIKQYQEETNMRCTILLDCSASMNYGSGKVTKFQYARMLAACLAKILNAQKDMVGLVGYHQDINVYIPPRNNSRHLRRILLELEGMEPAGTTDTAGMLAYLGNLLAPRGMVILISDLLHPVEETIDHLKFLCARRHDLLVLQISDPAEQTFPFDRSVTFVDAEDDRHQFTVPDEVRAEYLENRKRHFDLIRKECHSVEIDLGEFPTAEPLDQALHFFMKRRFHRLLRSSRRQRQAHRGGS